MFLLTVTSSSFAFEGELRIHVTSTTTFTAERVSWVCWQPYGDGNSITSGYDNVQATGTRSGSAKFDTEGDGSNTLGRSIYKISTGSSYFYLNTVGDDYFDLIISYNNSNHNFYYGDSGSGTQIPNATLLSNVESQDLSNLETAWSESNSAYLLGSDELYSAYEDLYYSNPTIFWAPNNTFNPTHYKIYRSVTPNGSVFNLIATVSSSNISYTDTDIRIRNNDTEITYKVKAYKFITPKSYYSAYTNSIYTTGGFYKQIAPNALNKTENKITFNNYPNPFNPVTNISFSLDRKDMVSLSVYNSIGQQVAELYSGNVERNKMYEFAFNGVNYATGIYYYQLKTANFIETK